MNKGHLYIHLSRQPVPVSDSKNQTNQTNKQTKPTFLFMSNLNLGPQFSQPVLIGEKFASVWCDPGEDTILHLWAPD